MKKLFRYSFDFSVHFWL